MHLIDGIIKWHTPYPKTVLNEEQTVPGKRTVFHMCERTKQVCCIVESLFLFAWSKDNDTLASSPILSVENRRNSQWTSPMTLESVRSFINLIVEQNSLTIFHRFLQWVHIHVRYFNCLSRKPWALAVPCLPYHRRPKWIARLSRI